MERINLSSNAPLEIQQKASRMNTVCEEIEDLRSQLRAAEALWFSLKDEVAHYIWKPRSQAAVAAPPVRDSLSRLPDELLYDIFRRLRLEPNSHLGALLLINKRIHRFVMNTPLLWTRIELRVDNDLMTTTLPRRSFIEACIERSQCAGLDVEIDLEWDTTEQFLQQAVGDELIRLVDEEDYDAVWSIFRTMDMDFSCSIYEEKCLAMLDLLDIIVGTSGHNMCRWKSLILKLPMDITHVFSVLSRFVGDTPTLHELEIQRIEYDDPEVWEGVLPNLSGLLCIKSDDYLPWASFKINPMLKELKIRACDIEVLSSYRALQHLDIRWEIDELPRNRTVFLPNLRTLRIEGRFNEVFHHLRTPPLDNLSVASFDTYIEFELPTSAVVQWQFWGCSKDGSSELLGQLLPRLGTTQNLLLYGIPESVLVDSLCALMRYIPFSEELQTIVLERYPDAPGPPILRLGRSALRKYL